MILKPNPVSMRQFSYDDRTRTFTADMSDTRGLGRVYDDACDDGLTIVSPVSGAERVFVVQSVERDREGDVTRWLLASLEGGFRMILWND